MNKPQNPEKYIIYIKPEDNDPIVSRMWPTGYCEKDGSNPEYTLHILLTDGNRIDLILADGEITLHEYQQIK